MAKTILTLSRYRGRLSATLAATPTPTKARKLLTSNLDTWRGSVDEEAALDAAGVEIF